MRLPIIVFFLVISVIRPVLAQNAYVNLGRQALLDGDFRAAVAQLEKACVIDSTNANALLMLGYSYYHSESFKKCIAAYSRVIALKPAESSAYYFRARAESYMGRDPQANTAQKEKYLLGAIVDFTKAIAIDNEDIKNYQNRGIAYRDYGLFKLQSNKPADKIRGINSLKASIADFQKILNDNPSRGDIETLMNLSKDKLNYAVNHH